MKHPRRRPSGPGRLPTAIGVALAALGWAPGMAANATDASLEALRAEITLRAPAIGTLSYLRAGDPAGQRVILVHGTPGAADDWSDYLLSPPPGMEVLAPDRPGFGRSGPARAVTRLAEQASALRALLPPDGRPVVLLGHSLGGPIVAELAAQLALEEPGRVAGIVLLAAALDPGQEEIHPLQRMAAWPWVSAMLPRVLRNANDELMALEPELRLLAERLPRITAKVVIVHGTRDDLVPVANVPFMRSRLTGARCLKTVLLEGQNHFLPWNSAATVREALKSAADPAC